MFGSALSTIRQSAKDAVYKPQEFEIDGIDIIYAAEKNGSHWREWEPLFQKWIPRLNDAGWLDGLNRMEIGRMYLQGDGVAEYRHDAQTIAFHDDPSFNNYNLVGETKEYAIIHESTHHAHMNQLFGESHGGVDRSSLRTLQAQLSWDLHKPTFGINVSRYAATNFLEAVAETSAGVAMGHSYPEIVKDAYYLLDGPDPLEEWSIHAI